MAAWLACVHNILGTREELAASAATLEALAKKQEEQRADLLRLCADIGIDAADSSPSDSLYKRARAAIGQLQESLAKSSAGIALRDEAQRGLTRARRMSSGSMRNCNRRWSPGPAHCRR